MIDDYNKNDGWWGTVILIAIISFISLMFMTSCKTKRIIEKEYISDTVVCIDTVLEKYVEMKFDTTYVHDSYTEKYYIGSIDTLYNIRVDTVKVATVQYIYKERTSDKNDSVAHVKENIQKSETSKTSVTEVKDDGKGADWYVKMIVLIIILATIFVAVWYAGRWIDRCKDK